MKLKTNDATILLRLPSKLRNQLQRYADRKDGSNVSETARKALKAWIELNK